MKRSFLYVWYCSLNIYLQYVKYENGHVWHKLAFITVLPQNFIAACDLSSSLPSKAGMSKFPVPECYNVVSVYKDTVFCLCLSLWQHPPFKV